METVASKLHNWAMTELKMVSEGSSRNIPDSEKLKVLTKSSKHRRIWNYVINHVRSKATVDKVKRTLRLKEYRNSFANGFIVPSTSVTEETTIVEKLAKARERNTFLKKELSSLEDSILNVEKRIENLKEEAKKLNQESAFLDLLSKNHNKSTATLKLLAEQISCHFNHLRSFETFRQPELSLTYPFGCDVRVKEIMSVIFALVENKITIQNTCDEQLREHLQKKNSELKDSGYQLNDLLVCLQAFSDSDRHKFASTVLQKTVFLKDFLSQSKEGKCAKQLFFWMEKDNVYYSLRSIQNRSKVSQLLVIKNDIIDTLTESLKKSESICDLDIAVSLFEKMTENTALYVSNRYLKEMLQMIADRTEIIKRSSIDKDNCSIKSSIDSFYKYANVTFYLLNTAPEALERVAEDLRKLQAYARNGLFSSKDLMLNNDETEWKANCDKNMELSWKFVEKISLAEPFKMHDFGDSLTPEARKLLNVEVFESVVASLRKVMEMKEVLQVETKVHSKILANDHNINISRMHSTIKLMLSDSKSLLERGLKYANEGKNYCSEVYDLLREWWEQDAQFIPKIEHEGKTLEMWTNILCLLMNFEP